jgi:hypothetical protein
VLLHIAREMYPGIKAVFINTGLEYPEIVQFVKTFDNVDIIRPKMSFRQVIEKYGYPFISKEVSECVYGARRYLTAVLAEQNAVDRQTDRQTGSTYHTSTGSKDYVDMVSMRKLTGGVRQEVSKGQRTCRIPYSHEWNKLNGTGKFGKRFAVAKLGGGKAKDFANLIGIRTVDGSIDARLWEGHRQFTDSAPDGDKPDGRQSNDGDYP